MNELHGGDFIKNEAVDPCTIGVCLFERGRVDFTKLKDLRILVVGIKEVKLDRVVSLDVMSDNAYQVEALGAVVALVIQDNE